MSLSLSKKRRLVIAMRISEARKAAGLTQAVLGERIAQATGSRTGRVVVSHWETGNRIPRDYRTLKAIAEATGTTVEHLASDP